MESFVNGLISIIWSPVLVFVLLFLGVYFSIRMCFPQIRFFKKMLKLSFTVRESQKGLTPYQTFALTVGGRVGIGNIAGVATGIALGGPGAVFWMTLLAFLASSSAFIEAALAQIYKVEIEGQYRGGPAFYIEKGLKQKWFASLFAVCVILGLGVCVPGIQTFNIVDSAKNAFGLDGLITGGAVCLLVAFSICGSAKHLSRVSAVVTPFMAGAYILTSIIIIMANFTRVPEALGLIFSSAFGVHAVFGAIIGSAVSWGVRRGLYSSDAGIGVGAIASGSSDAGHPAEQGLIQACSVLAGTLVISLMTALTLLTTNAYNVINEKTGGFIVEYLPGIEYGPGYSQAAMNSLAPGLGGAFVAIAIFFFAFTSIIAFYHYAESNLLYLLPKNNPRLIRTGTWVLRVIFLFSTFLGVSNSAKMLWNLADVGIGIMAWVNLAAIFLLQNQAVKVLKDYDRQLKDGREPSFDPDAVGLPQASDVWRRKTASHDGPDK